MNNNKFEASELSRANVRRLINDLDSSIQSVELALFKIDTEFVDIDEIQVVRDDVIDSMMLLRGVSETMIALRLKLVSIDSVRVSNFLFWGWATTIMNKDFHFRIL